MRRKWGIYLKTFLLLLDEILIAVLIILVLRELGVHVPFWGYVVAGVVCVALYWLLYRLLLGQHKKSPVGHDAMIGLTGECIRELNPEGLIRVQGEIWKAVSKCGVVVEGAEVVIEEFRGLTLTVKPKNDFK